MWIKDKPDNVSLFDSDPGEIEPELLHGRWLMIVYSMLSGPDAQVAVSAGDIARELDGTVRIGIRPTRAFTESKTWIPTFDDIEHLDEMARIDSPLWLIIDGGKVTSWHCGRMNVEQAVTFAKK